MRKLLLPLLLIVVSVSCTKQKTFNRSFYHTILSPTNEVPARVSADYGDASGFFDNDTKILTLTINYVGLSAPLTVWHIHKAAAGVNGSVIFNLGSPQKSGFVYVSPAFTAEQEADLKNGLNYVNLHSTLYPGGELRGQLRSY